MEKKKNQAMPPLYTVVKLCFLIILGMGTVMMAAGMTGMEKAGYTITVVVFSAVIALAAGRLIRFCSLRLLMLVFIWFIFVWFCREAVTAGAVKTLDIIQKTASDYFGHRPETDIVLSAAEMSDIAMFFAAAAAAWEGFLVTLNEKKSRPAVTAVLTGAVIAFIFGIGQVPDQAALFMTALGFFGLVSMNVFSREDSRAVLKSSVAAALILAVVTGAVSWAMPADGYIKEADKDSIRSSVRAQYEKIGTYFEEGGLRRTPASMGISEGRLDRASDLNYTGQTVMEISMNRRAVSPVYLKAYAAGDFKNNRWMEMPDNGLEDISRSFSENSSGYLKNLWNIGYTAFGGSDTLMAIRTVDMSDEHCYVPYGTQLESGDEMSGEGYVTQLNGGRERVFPYVGSFFSMMDDVDGFASVGGVYVSDSVRRAALNAYDSYVRENYLSVSGMSDKFQRDYKIADGSSAGLVTDYIRQKFADEGVFYTLEPGPQPFGENAIEYFLYENKKGYCMHFASAAVMIYRLNGIPARYAEGYIVPEGSFKQTASGYDTESELQFESIVRDYQAHAWPEIFIENFGWVPVEATPAYTEGGLPQTAESIGKENTDESGETEDTSETDMAETDMTETDMAETDTAETDMTGTDTTGKDMSDTADGGDKDKNFGTQVWEGLKGIFLTLLAAVFVGAAAGITVYRQRRRERALGEPYREDTAGKLWAYTRRWLMLARITAAKTGDAAAVAAALEKNDTKQPMRQRGQGRRTLTVDETVFVCLTELLLKAMYSRDGLEQKEYRHMIGLYEQLAGEIYSQLGIFRKLAARLVWCLPVCVKKNLEHGSI